MYDTPKPKPYDVMPFCRCGRKTVWGDTGHPECPMSRSKSDRTSFTYHDMTAQIYAILSGEINWEVRQEADGRFRAYANSSIFSPITHARESAAWLELDKAMWNEVDWADDEFPEEEEEAA